MRRLGGLIALLAAGLAASSTFAARPSIAPWSVVAEVDEDRGAPYAQCDVPELGSTGMAENDYWYRVDEGTLPAGATWQVTNPRPVCESTWPARVAWRFLGNGKTPTGIVLEVVDPAGGATYRTDAETVVATKGGQPLWVRRCTNVSTEQAFGTWTFRVVNTGTRPVTMRVAASIADYEFPIQQCPNWLTALSQLGI